jgi:chromosome segregation ATPase
MSGAKRTLNTSTYQSKVATELAKCKKMLKNYLSPVSGQEKEPAVTSSKSKNVNLVAETPAPTSAQVASEYDVPLDRSGEIVVDIKKKQQEIEEWKGKFDTSENELKELKVKLSSAQKSETSMYEESEKNKKEWSTKISELHNENLKLNTTITQQHLTISTEQKKLEESQRQAQQTEQDLRNEIQDLKSQLAEADRERELLTQENGRLKSENTELNVCVTGSFNVMSTKEANTINIDSVLRQFQSIRDNTVSNLVDSVMEAANIEDDERAEILLALSKKIAYNTFWEMVLPPSKSEEAKNATEETISGYVQAMNKGIVILLEPYLGTLADDMLFSTAKDIVSFHVNCCKLVPQATLFEAKVGEEVNEATHKLVSRSKTSNVITECVQPGLMTSLGTILERPEVSTR